MLDIAKSHEISLVPTSSLDKPLVSLVPAAQKAVEMLS